VSTRRQISLLFVVFVLVAGSLAAACGGSGDDDDGGDSSGDSANEETSGGGAENDAQQIFIDTGCAECHGENGEGDGENERTVLADNQLLTLGQFQQRIRNGRGSAMPAYTAEQISDEQIQLIFEWLVGS
jgi:mono/diheme cytochrome c family protein